MANNLYTTKTAALKATKADINKLDAKKLLLNGKNILDYISDSEFNSYDTRDPQLKNDELDIWNTEISLSDNGHIEVKPFVHTYKEMTDEQKELLLNSAVKVIDNEVLTINDRHLMYWQTDGLTDSFYMIDVDDDGEHDGEMSVFCHYDYAFGPSSPLITTFNSDLSSLTDGCGMFLYCTALTSFTSDLSSLTHGLYMFNECTNLTSFNADLPNLTTADGMFADCTNLTSFNSDLSSLTSGGHMFNQCTNLTSFNADLSSLTIGDGMFDGCLLDAQSVANIVHTIKDTYTGDPLVPMTNITIGIGCYATEEDQLRFAQECDCETWEELLDDFALKNWGVDFQCNGRPTTTYNMRRGETLPVYTKLVEVTDEKYAHYSSTDGSKFYNINYFHSTNGSTEGYDVFSSLEEAISTYNVTPKN